MRFDLIKAATMKNLLKIISAFRGFLFFSFFFSATLMIAQPNCSVTINNKLGCEVELDIRFLEFNPSCIDCPGNPISITVSANGSTGMTCTTAGLWACSSMVCDLSVTFTQPFSAGPFSFSNGMAPLTGLPPGCLATVNANISFTANTIDINP